MVMRRVCEVKPKPDLTPPEPEPPKRLAAETVVPSLLSSIDISQPFGTAPEDGSEMTRWKGVVWFQTERRSVGIGPDCGCDRAAPPELTDLQTHGAAMHEVYNLDG